MHLDTLDTKAGVISPVVPRPGKRCTLDKDNEAEATADEADKAQGWSRVKLEHPFRVIKQQFGYVKVRYRGLRG
jgi:IS5 family transposase